MFSTAKNVAKISFNKSNFQSIAKCSSKAVHQGALKSSTASNVALQTFGQPLPHTHPHLLKKGEIVPGVQSDEFANRRNTLMEKIAKFAWDRQIASSQLVVIPSATKVYMSEHIPYVFRQNSDFLYFTGCQEPDSILLLNVKGDSCSTILFMRPKDAHMELWDGPRTGVQAAQPLFKVDQVLLINDFEPYLSSFLNENKKSNIWYDHEDIVQPQVHEKLVQLVQLSDRKSFNSPKTLIHEMRLIKSESEIKLMKKSCEIASAAIAKTIEISKPGITEHELFATVDYECRMRGAEFLAYPPVVAAGKNANTIHYIANNQKVSSREMVLMDAGCEYHGYSSDITRTWPIEGRFTDEQRILYEIVLDVQKSLINKLQDMPTLDQLFKDMFLLLSKRLQEAHLLPKSLSSNKLLSAAYTYCPHHVSHYLGMDVHDTGKISRSICVQPGMIVTVEPGIYVNSKNQYAPPEFHNLGIRIEDDILICEGSPVNLTVNCPKEIADIEALARSNKKFQIEWS